MGGIGAWESLFIVAMLSSLVLTGLWIFELVHCVLNRRLSDHYRIVGVLLLCLAGPIGMIVYPFLPRESEPQR